MTPLHDTLNDLEEKAKKATQGRFQFRSTPVYGIRVLNSLGKTLVRLGPASNLRMDAEYIAACSPETVLTLITALREAEEALKRIENPVLRGRPSYADWELRLIARDWRAKFRCAQGPTDKTKGEK